MYRAGASYFRLVHPARELKSKTGHEHVNSCAYTHVRMRCVTVDMSIILTSPRIYHSPEEFTIYLHYHCFNVSHAPTRCLLVLDCVLNCVDPDCDCASHRVS